MRSTLTRGVASVLAMSLLAGTAGAAEPAPPTLWSAASEAGSRPGATTAQTTVAPAASSSLNDKSFFKTTAGKVSLALMAAGLGATLYAFHDSRKPVKSPVR